MKRVMEWRNFFSETPGDPSERGTRQPPSAEEAPPKNGRLTLAVLGSIALLIVLGLLNVRLMRDPTIVGKNIRPSTECEPLPEWLSTPVKTPSLGEAKPRYAPPEVSFYRELTAQEEQIVPGPGETQKEPQSEAGPVQHGTGVASATDRKAERSFHRPAMSGSSTLAAENQEAVLSKYEQPAKVYTVQVGAFSHPGIAQEWALRWKARGYDATLKPVARPRTGVIYRLYLGRFSSEKEAEDLVQHLKSKEGISAFWLAVR